MRIPLSKQVVDLSVEAPVAATKDAATIAVVRDGDSGLEIFLMRRHQNMDFAAGMYVFPGGGVQSGDEAPISWTGPSAEDFAQRLGCEPWLAHSLVVAAIRETFEETGVLLAGPNSQSVVRDVTALHDWRAALERREVTFATFLHAHNLTLRADLLGAWSHWITPVVEPRRYDTRFFVAVLPDGQHIDSVNSEADQSAWIPLASVPELVAGSQAAMLTPTLFTCKELAQETSVSVLRTAAKRRIWAIVPRVVVDNDELWLEIEGDDALWE